jgi:hypothetical protein
MEQGLGHQPEEKILDGSMAIFCPACPQPGINLPDDWNTRYQPYITWLPLDVFARLIIYWFKEMNSSGHSSWTETSLLST